MSTRHGLSAIRFREIDPIPSEIIPGGTVVEIARVRWIDGPIGTIVSRPSDKLPDPMSGGEGAHALVFHPHERHRPDH